MTPVKFGHLGTIPDRPVSVVGRCPHVVRGQVIEPESVCLGDWAVGKCVHGVASGASPADTYQDFTCISDFIQRLGDHVEVVGGGVQSLLPAKHDHQRSTALCLPWSQNAHSGWNRSPERSCALSERDVTRVASRPNDTPIMHAEGVVDREVPDAAHRGVLVL